MMRKIFVVTIVVLLFVAIAPVNAQDDSQCLPGETKLIVSAGSVLNGFRFLSDTAVCVIPDTSSNADTVTTLTVASATFQIDETGNIFLANTVQDILDTGVKATLIAKEDVIVNYCGPTGCYNGEILIKSGQTCTINADAGDSSGIRVLNATATNAATGEGEWATDAQTLVNANPRVYSTLPTDITCTATASGQ